MYDTNGDGWQGASFYVRTTTTAAVVASGALDDGASGDARICLVDDCYLLEVNGGAPRRYSQISFEFADDFGGQFQDLAAPFSHIFCAAWGDIYNRPTAQPSMAVSTPAPTGNPPSSSTTVVVPLIALYVAAAGVIIAALVYYFQCRKVPSKLSSVHTSADIEDGNVVGAPPLVARVLALVGGREQNAANGYAVPKPPSSEEGSITPAAQDGSQIDNAAARDVDAKRANKSNRASSALVAVTSTGGAVALGGGTAEDFALGATEAFRVVLDVGEHIPLVGGCFKMIKTFANVTIDVMEMNKTVKTMHVALHGYTVALEKAARVGADAAVDDATVELVAIAEEQLRALVHLTSQHQGSSAILKALKTNTFKQLWRNSLAAIDALVNALQVGLAADVLAATQNAAAQARDANAGVRSMLDVVIEKVDTVLEVQGAMADDANALKQSLEKKNLKEKARERKNEALNDLEIELESLEAEPFATGGFGAVFRGELGGDVVAVKKTTLGQMSRLEREKRLRDVSKEVAILNSMRHPRIVLVYGMISSDPMGVSIVLEFCPGGSLREHLDARLAESSTGCGGAPEITRWLADAAAGMAYLYNKDVEHRDLKSASESWFPLLSLRVAS